MQSVLWEAPENEHVTIGEASKRSPILFLTASQMLFAQELISGSVVTMTRENLSTHNHQCVLLLRQWGDILTLCHLKVLKGIMYIIYITISNNNKHIMCYSYTQISSHNEI